MLLLLSAVALAGPSPAELFDLELAKAFRVDGPDQVQLDLMRPFPGAAKIYVQATLPNGELGTFMIDTGADITVLDDDLVERLGLAPDQQITVEGMGGSSRAHQTRLSSIELGDMTVRDIDVAYDVPGWGSMAGLMPVDGILGNNVWRRFVMEIDYPADTLVLHRPGKVKVPRKSAPLLAAGGHIVTPVEITTESNHRATIELMLDTGAIDVLISGSAGDSFATVDYSEGIEPLGGVGASETMPPMRFLQRTRRINLQKVRLGGVEVETRGMRARWVNFDTSIMVGPQGMTGLAGHYLMDDHVAWIDFQGATFALAKSKREPRQINGHRVLLDRDELQYRDDPWRSLYRAKLLVGLDDLDGAVDLIEQYLDLPPDERPDDPQVGTEGEARVLLARVHRSRGDLDKAWAALEGSDPGWLVDEHEVVASVNGLLLEGRADEARTLAEAALLARPDEGAAWVAIADVRLQAGEYEAARDALLHAAELTEYPDAHLMRRARVALASGDRLGSMAHVRKQMQLYPAFGEYLWFYAMLLDDKGEAHTFRADMAHAMGRLHQQGRPIDFMVAAHRLLGDEEDALKLMSEGIERECVPIGDGPSQDNCYAWFWSLAGTRPDDALERIERALAAEGDRPDFLDTKAMVHLARGEYAKAHEAAVSAARLSPDDVYMLWQAERIGEIAASYRQRPHGG